MEEGEWKQLAIEKQAAYYETLGSRHCDEIDKKDLFLLKKKVGYATCGKPEELPSSTNYNTGYKKEELKHIKSICDKIIEKSDRDPIKFSCTILILNLKGSLCETPVFRIITDTGNLFIDINSRVYLNWDMFIENNKLPECEYCFPVGGEYDMEKELVVGFAFSPASKLFNKATNCLDTAGSVAAVAAAGVFAAGAFVSVAPVALSAAGATALCTGVYSVTRSVGSLYDRNKHDQSIGLKDQESRSAWMAIGSSAVGLSQMAALRGAQKVVESGRSLGKLSVFGLHALTASSLVISGFGFVENLFNFADKYNKGSLSKKDVFDLSCELLFLCNAIASAKATSQLVNNMNLAVVEASSQKKLTKTQKRNLRRRVAKRKAKGLPVNVSEETNKFATVGISGTLQLLLFEAVKAYSPRLQEILYTCQSIGHDVMCWRTHEISDFVLLKNLGEKFIKLYNNHKDEILEVVNRIKKFFSSIIDEFLQFVSKLFETASEELKQIFCSKVIDMEDEMELLINEAEGSVISLHESLKLDYNPASFDCNDECESLDDDNLNPETQNLLKSCSEVIDASNLCCNDIEDFEDILDSVKHVVVSEHKRKLDEYMKSLKAAKAASGDGFSVEIFHSMLGVRGEVSNHILKEILSEVTTDSTIYKIKSKLKDMKNTKDRSTIPVWEALTSGMYQYYGPHGTGELSLDKLLLVVKDAVGPIVVDNKRLNLDAENLSRIQEKDIVMFSINDQPNVQIVVFCGITEENTATGLIMVVK
ncbi:uncharacterized protein LOC129004918 [Macrosteles quadrilineatus]|uniref:uncharacterized protein LOC129004918 n=1 Tax=Macrosteles quadrilineatus TaxID=74068 RepID=UPI0023E0CC54|nr:uncharacterized protein LOC129004918 [Macrosteles quadrilineatus]